MSDDHDDVEAPLLEPVGPEVPGDARPATRLRLVALAAAAVLLVGAVVLANQPDDGPPDDDEDTELDLEPTVLELAGPRDGNESIGLPIMVEPAIGLVDGQTVTATSGGFVAGEGVGIVQCADAAPDEPGNAIDLCNIDGYTNLTASSDGIASGTYDVRRHLTTPRSGSVDCAVEVRRCFLAMGAINDYDRSGGFELEFLLEGPASTGATTTPPPPAVVGPPSASAVPSVELEDGDVVQLTASGLVEGQRLEASLCAVDPEVCWPLVAPEPASDDPLGIVVTAGGYVDVPLQVWRFLPGPRAGTYVDCAVSQCRIHLTGGTVPDPLVLGFSAAAEPPTGPSLLVDPSKDLAPDATVTITGTGFGPDAAVRLELCAVDGDDRSILLGCTGLGAGDVTVDGEGAFIVDARLDGTDGGATDTTVTACAQPSTTAVPGEAPEPEPAEPCPPTGSRPGGVCTREPDATCAVRAVLLGTVSYGRPAFTPGPVPVTFLSAD